MDRYYIFPVAPRTKKNHGQLVTLKNGRQMMLPSKSYVAFEKAILKHIKEHSEIDYSTINEPINLCCHFYKDKDYKADLTGYLQAIQDVLVKAKVLADDNHKIVCSTDGSFVSLDREHPRVEVFIQDVQLSNIKGMINEENSK